MDLGNFYFRWQCQLSKLDLSRKRKTKKPRPGIQQGIAAKQWSGTLAHGALGGLRNESPRCQRGQGGRDLEPPCHLQLSINLLGTLTQANDRIHELDTAGVFRPK